MNHTPYIDGRLFRCSACSWRAVLTTDQRLMQTQAGDSGHDHIGQARVFRARALAMRQQLTEATLDRLRRQYSERQLLPNGDELSLNQLQRLYRAVMGEHAL